MKKTEIIKEIMQGYIEDPSTRGTTTKHGGYCYYNATTSNKCAVGKCMEDYLFEGEYESHEGVVALGGNVLDTVQCIEDEYFYAMPEVKDFDELLKEEYRGHHTHFWEDLQNFHDSDDNFNAKGLTPVGKTRYNLLLDIYENK
jgi:hypothetical protein